ncbi:MAG: DUF177 domain-containing protein [Rikenellaceae bacterium]
MGNNKGCTIAYKSLGLGLFDYHFDLDNEFFSQFEGSEITAGNCGVEVQLRRAESMLEVDVQIEGEVIVACDRCLEDCQIAIDYEGRLIVKFSSEVEDYDGEILWISPLESEVDLNQYIYESVVLSLPYQRVHAEGECNEEMTRKFAMISGEELERLEHDVEELNSDAESHGLAADDLAKLQALRAMMSEE